MRSITVVAEDRVGLLADISYILGKSGIAIESLGVDVVGEKAIVAMMVRDPKRTAVVLGRNGFHVAQNDALVVKLPNQPGAINQLATQLAEERIAIENIHMLSSDSEHGAFALFVNKPRKAMRMLSHSLFSGTENPLY